MSLSKENVKYICEVHEDEGTEKYYKQVFLTEFKIWGVKKAVTKQTFSKQKNAGYKVEYYKSEIDFNSLKEDAKDIDSLIDLALDTKDEKWFMQLTRKRNLLISIIN